MEIFPLLKTWIYCGELARDRPWVNSNSQANLSSSGAVWIVKKDAKTMYTRKSNFWEHQKHISTGNELRVAKDTFSLTATFATGHTDIHGLWHDIYHGTYCSPNTNTKVAMSISLKIPNWKMTGMHGLHMLLCIWLNTCIWRRIYFLAFFSTSLCHTLYILELVIFIMASQGKFCLCFIFWHQNRSCTPELSPFSVDTSNPGKGIENEATAYILSTNELFVILLTMSESRTGRSELDLMWKTIIALQRFWIWDALR